MSIVILKKMPALDKFKIKRLAERMTDQEFYEFASANDDLRMERDKHGNIIIMAPVNSFSGFLENEVSSELHDWNKKDQTGITFSSSAGFTLPDTSVKSPDAAWLSLPKWKALTMAEKKRFAPVCPEFVAEIRSESDNLKDLHEKMTDWIANGALLAWLIDPIAEEVHIYRADGTVETVQGFDKILSGESVLPGFKFDLKNLRVP